MDRPEVARPPVVALAPTPGGPGAAGPWARFRRWYATLGAEKQALLILPLLAIPPWWLNQYVLGVMTIIGIYVVLALGLNVVLGFAGLLDLGYIAFYAIGAYATGLLTTREGWPVWAVFPVAAVAAAVFGVLIGAPTLRLRGDYLAIVTLGFGEMVRIALNNWTRLTGGPSGILHIQHPQVGAYNFSLLPRPYYYMMLVACILTFVFMSRINSSRIGRAWAAIREDETAAEAMGVDTVRLKLLAFATGASFAGVAGVFFASRMGFISPQSFTLNESVLIVMMVVLGGMGSVPGAILGAVLLVGLPELFRPLLYYRDLIFGVAMVAIILIRPQGLVPSRRREAELREDEDPDEPDDATPDAHSPAAAESYTGGAV
ncbi:MAG: branched-chain amino acid ABC transporter permease [Chloroflexota bacterium]